MLMIRKTIRCAFAAAVLLLPAQQIHAGPIYDVFLDGTNVDLVGFIEVNSTGNFTPNAFDGQVVDFSITASLNGAFPFVFTLANSTWGPTGFGAHVTIGVTATEITLAAPTGGNFDARNLFLLADAVTNGARENLRIFQDQLGYRTPNPPNDVVFETVATPFVLATARVPEPGTLALLGLGLSFFGFARRRTR
jgi:hypothetical protein